MTVIPAIILSCAVGYIYTNYFKPVPKEYEFMRAESDICSVEYAIISFDEDGNVSAQGFGFVNDTEGLKNELKELDCYKGFPLDAIYNLRNGNTIPGFVINYTDGSFEMITPYFCVNSDLNITKLEDILSANVYCFNKDDIYNLIKKYSDSGNTNA